MINMTDSKVVRLGNGVFVTPFTDAQETSEARMDGGLCYPAQGRGLRTGQFVLPIWTDGDGGYFAIGRGGEILDL